MPLDPSGAEKDLLARCLAGEPLRYASGIASPWDAFVLRYTRLIAWQVRETLVKCGAPAPSDTVQDLVQETFLRLFRNDAALLRGFAWDCSLDHYLVRVASSRVIDHLRREALRAPPSWADQEGRLLEECSWEGAGARSSLEASDRAELLRQALEKLPERERLALRLFYWESLPAEEIARLFKVAPGSARTLLTRAREHLREFLKGAGLFLALVFLRIS